MSRNRKFGPNLRPNHQNVLADLGDGPDALVQFAQKKRFTNSSGEATILSDSHNALTGSLGWTGGFVRRFVRVTRGRSGFDWVS